jgi:membrane-associated phospholipid phosphatase
MWLAKLRASEWVLVGFFCYAAAIAPFLHERRHVGVQPAFASVIVIVLVACIAQLSTRLGHIMNVARDWAPLAFLFLGFREMEFFVPMTYSGQLESRWIRWDHHLLAGLHLRAAIESAGQLFPSVLEVCYFLVYGVPFYCLALLYVRHRRTDVDRFLTLYLIGTASAYALLPYFPSLPPRFAYPQLDFPSVTTLPRRLNLFVLNVGTIHTGVFPSAHVSSAFAASWALFFIFGWRKPFGWVMLGYSIAVSIATVYGRYHYASDVLAGFLISLIPGSLALVLWIQRTHRYQGERELSESHLPTLQE